MMATMLAETRSCW